MYNFYSSSVKLFLIFSIILLLYVFDNLLFGLDWIGLDSIVFAFLK